ncbi:hypothetical protein [Aurantiacibacter poecillastricola]|uniref:hypothetical protein n=1 Tax=Aurantiacibacter poecillastricola TaxID=3064385 RepID=UPI00273D7028|nr:hypothetical protein [Aurantiacibacter sp. 219JJ12-13]MDP5263070.1 hypothetical protein [Aurantiacibacter sp. 219JJ12-13]
MRSSRPASRPARASIARVMAIPTLLVLGSISGLVLGLTGDGLPDLLAWGLLSIPIILSMIAFVRRG